MIQNLSFILGNDACFNILQINRILCLPISQTLIPAILVTGVANLINYGLQSSAPPILFV